MKKILVLLSAVTLFVVAGCSTFDKAALTATPNITPAVTNAVTGAVTPPATNTTYAPNPALVAGIQQAQTYTGLIPPPYGTAVDGVLALALAGLGLYARSKNGKLSTANSVINAVVSGVEAAGHPETKVAIQKAAVAAGVQGSLEPVVQSVGQQMKV